MFLRKLLGLTLIWAALGVFNPLFASDEHKSAAAFRIDEPISVDGVLNEPVWQTASPASGFRQFEPSNGSPSCQNAEVRVIYDNTALYIGAMLFDSAPDSIMKEMGLRDSGTEVNADVFSIMLDTYHDKQNAYMFMVSAAGVQTDGRVSRLGEDLSWDAVWDSEVSQTSEGWVVEMQIPWSALRFSKDNQGLWGVNFFRAVRRKREQAFWNYVDNSIDGRVNQEGDLTGITQIESPMRLSITPFIALYEIHLPDPGYGQRRDNLQLTGGMDLKYGLSDAFTLDMTLVPDFGQVQSDNLVLNLSPFEIQFQERRPFFTEGVEIFNASGIFYSRRVGGRPIDYYKPYDQLEEGERVIENPEQSQLINAFKVSGRTLKGTGLGIFNGISAPMYATVLDSATKEKRQILTQPLTNYSVAVVDQTLKNNSSFSFTNTNVYRAEGGRMANVSAGRFKLADKENKYNFTGWAGYSAKFDEENQNPDLGYRYTARLAKVSGNFQWNINQRTESDTYNPNDLGFLFNPNEFTTSAQVNYNIYKPFGKFNSFWSGASVTNEMLYAPREFVKFSINSWVTFVPKTFHAFGIYTWVVPTQVNDFFEPRTWGKVLIRPGSSGFNAWVSTNYAKRLALDANIDFDYSKPYNQRYTSVGIEPRFRFNDKLFMQHRLDLSLSTNNQGFVNNTDDDDIIIGQRDLLTVTNTFSGKYSFTNRIAINLRVRHYWSQADYNDYLVLQDDGWLGETEYGEDHNVNFNAFNVDCVFTWRFAPGSDFNVVWKNAILNRESELARNYFANLNSTLDSPQFNSLSFKILFYLDYLTAKRQLGR